ncbi:hypothetical protein NJ7G_3532 [Natrinema sp. J7-2]|nr:hypothetical protein NJ7G_3532 [Natrinema sp. J7-2]
MIVPVTDSSDRETNSIARARRLTGIALVGWWDRSPGHPSAVQR